MDPDNGLLVPSVKKHYLRSVKYCFYEEAAQYIKQGYSILIYNHRSRKPELKYFRDIESRLYSNLPSEDIEILEITFPRYSVRDYFAIARPEHYEKIHDAFQTMLSGKDMSELQTIKTMLHELAHAICHNQIMQIVSNPPKDRQTMEVEAESIAYTVCQYWGLDTSDYSFSYVTGWSTGRDLKTLQKSMDFIHWRVMQLY